MTEADDKTFCSLLSHYALKLDMTPEDVMRDLIDVHIQGERVLTKEEIEFTKVLVSVMVSKMIERLT